MTTDHPEIEIRLLEADDSPELVRLAQLDSARPLPHPLLGGIVDGRLVAAHSLVTGESIADPFRRTAEIRSLLAERAGELGHGRGREVLSRARRGFGGRIGAPPGPASEALR